MQRAEDDVAGFGRLDGGVDRLQVAHFADEDDVGVHTQGPADAFGEVGHVDADLALVDRALLVLVVILDRVFQRDDVPIVVLVDEVDHAGQAGRLAGAGRAGDQQQAARPGDQPVDGLGHADLLEGQELARNAPQHHADVAVLLEDGDAEAVAVGELDGEVGPALFLQFLLAAVGRDALHQGGGVVAVERPWCRGGACGRGAGSPAAGRR